jgi:Ca2+-binding RTX toxin-like protein
MAIINGNFLPNFLVGTPLNDIINGFGGNDTLNGLGGNDVLNGGSGNDVLIGGFGHDVLNGGTGADRMAGGFGDDLYRIDNPGDSILEFAGQGIDRVESSLFFTNLSTLSPNVENLTLVGPVATTGVGNNLNNVIVGNGNSNGLFGLFGNDSMFGGFGNDLLNGGVGNDYLDGGVGNDKLIGGPGVDTMAGGFGADSFIFQSTFDSPPAFFEDRILDFNRFQGDRIDLSAIDANTGVFGNQAFTFVGFDPTPGTGQVGFSVVGGQTFVQVNTDADAAIEMQFKVSGPGVPGMLAGDFVL